MTTTAIESLTPAQIIALPGFKAALLATGSPLPSISVTFIGQSTEHGNVPITDTSYPQAFASLRNPTVTAPIFPAISYTGGWQLKVYDDLYDWGYDTQIVNAAIGSMSMLTQAAGYCQYRNTGTPYYQRRAANGPNDRGYAGSFMSPDGTSVWNCIKGNNLFAFGSGPSTMADIGYGGAYVDYTASLPGSLLPLRNLVTAGSYTASTTNGSTSLVVTALTGGSLVHSVNYPITGSGIPSGTTITAGPASGATGTYTMSQAATATATGVTITETAPTFTNSVGTQVTDGDIVWQCISTTTAAPYANAGTVLTETNKGFGFDPFGILMRGHDETARLKHNQRRFIYIANGQGDVGNGSTIYQNALQSVATFYLNRGYEVIIGFTSFSPGTSGALTAWNNLQTGKNNAISNLQALYPNRVWAGADLYALMGTTGVMGGAKITGSISNSTLTVAATSQGTIEVGHNVWSGTTLVGTITSGSGTSWTLSNAVTTASGALIVAGSFLQYDGVHLNGAGCCGPTVNGVANAGSYVSAAIKNIVAKTQWATV